MKVLITILFLVLFGSTQYMIKQDAQIEQVTTSPRLYEPADFQWQGVLYWGDWRWTYYSQRILPGPGLEIPGRHVDQDGYVCDENDYICIASSTLSKGTIVDTPLGKQGKIYDCGCPSDVLDVYTDW